LLVDNQPVTNLDSPERLKVSPGRHRFEFQYTALSFAAPEKVHFQHRLDPLDADWNDAGTKRTAEYPYIPPGDYTFRVIACNNDGVWNNTGAALTFTVLPYFWQTTWFHIAGGFVTVLAASVAVWFDTRRRMRRKMELLEHQRAVERERTRIAKDIHDDLGASLTRINLLSQTARRDMTDPPQTVKNLDQICTTARQLTRAMDEIVWAVDPQHDTLDSLATYLGKLIHEVMADSGIRCRLDFPVNLPAWPVTAEVRHNLFLAFKEALHNVLKHSAATEVRITFALEPAAIVVNITDNGCGFDPSILNGAAGNGSHRPPRLNGVLNMRKRLQQIGGSCEIETQPGQGTQVKIFFPVKEMVK
jgi:signal transduction histidine kinase